MISEMGCWRVAFKRITPLLHQSSTPVFAVGVSGTGYFGQLLPQKEELRIPLHDHRRDGNAIDPYGVWKPPLLDLIRCQFISQDFLALGVFTGSRSRDSIFQRPCAKGSRTCWTGAEV